MRTDSLGPTPPAAPSVEATAPGGHEYYEYLLGAAFAAERPARGAAAEAGGAGMSGRRPARAAYGRTPDDLRALGGAPPPGLPARLGFAAHAPPASAAERAVQLAEHEAAHAVVAVRLGLSFASASVA